MSAETAIVDGSTVAPLGPSEEEWRLDLRTVLIIFSVMLGVLLEIIDTSIVNVALPAMMGSLGATLNEIDWVITGYIIANVIIMPVTGWLAARFGRKRYFVSSILLFTFASLMCGLSTTAWQLILWRIVQGLGGGALVTTSQTVLVETFPPSKQGVGQAIYGIGVIVGPSLGPTLGGWLTDNASWQWIFYINIPLGLIAATFAATYIEDPEFLKKMRPPRVDWPGLALLIIGVGALQTFLERGHKDDWFESTHIVVLASMAAFGLVALVIRELSTEHPIVDLRVLRHRALWVGCILNTLLGVGLYGTVYLMPLFTQTMLGWGAWNSGLAVLPSSAASAAVLLVSGQLTWILGPRPLLWFGMGSMMVALSMMSQWTTACGWDQIFWPQILRGMGTGTIGVALSTATLRALPTEQIQAGSGIYNLFRHLGGSLGIATLTTTLDHRATVHHAHAASPVGPLSDVVYEKLQSLASLFTQQGFDPATANHLALRTLDRFVSVDAHVEAFQDAYVLLFVLFLLALPLPFLVAKHAPGKMKTLD
jgi:DHA2 family multidrug resistance protein